MPNIYCVRAGYGGNADHFYQVGYVRTTPVIIFHCKFQF